MCSSLMLRDKLEDEVWAHEAEDCSESSGQKIKMCDTSSGSLEAQKMRHNDGESKHHSYCMLSCSIDSSGVSYGFLLSRVSVAPDVFTHKMEPQERTANAQFLIMGIAVSASLLMNHCLQ